MLVSCLVTRSTFVLVLVAAPALAQGVIPYDLVVSSDASQIYFVSSLTLAGNSSAYPNYNIYKYSQGGVTLFHAVSPGELPTRGGLSNSVSVGLEVTGDGYILAASFNDVYGPNGLCTPDQQMQHQCESGVNYSGQVFTASGERTYSSGPTILSRNGRYLYACNPACQLYDLALGTSQTVPLAVESIADDGTLSGIASGSPVIWTLQSGIQSIAQFAPSLSGVTLTGAFIDDTGSFLLVGATSPNSPAGTFYIVEISSGLANPLPAGYHFLRFSDSGSTIALIGKDTASMTQVFLANVDGSNPRQVTSEPSGIGSAAISGDGSVVIAANGYGEVIRIDVNAGRREVLFETGPQMSPTGNPSIPGAAPGSMVQVDGTALGSASAIAPPGVPLPTSLGGIQVLIDGVPAPILAVRPSSVRFQLPWEVPIAIHQIQVVRSSDSPFTPGNVPYFAAVQADLQFLQGGLFQVLPLEQGVPHLPPLVFHQDWSPVTYTSPAVVGEVLHFYVTGLGAVGDGILDGETTPDNPLFSVAHAPVFYPSGAPGADADYCSASGAEFQLMFAGLAPGTVGIYQMDLKLNSVSDFSPILLSCSVPSSSFLSSELLVYVAPQAGTGPSKMARHPSPLRSPLSTRGSH